MKHPWYQLADQHATNGSPGHMEASQSISRMSFRLQLYFACTFINQAKVQSASLAESVRELPPTPVCHESDLCFVTIHLQAKANVLAPPQVSPESIWPYGRGNTVIRPNYALWSIGCEQLSRLEAGSDAKPP